MRFKEWLYLGETDYRQLARDNDAESQLGNYGNPHSITNFSQLEPMPIQDDIPGMMAKLRRNTVSKPNIDQPQKTVLPAADKPIPKPKIETRADLAAAILTKSSNSEHFANLIKFILSKYYKADGGRGVSVPFPHVGKREILSFLSEYAKYCDRTFVPKPMSAMSFKYPLVHIINTYLERNSLPPFPSQWSYAVEYINSTWKTIREPAQTYYLMPGSEHAVKSLQDMILKAINQADLIRSKGGSRQGMFSIFNQTPPL